MKRKLLILFPILLVALLTSPTPALAIGDPDSLTIISTYAYGDVLETGDMLFVTYYDVEYGTIPDELISDTYLGRFMEGTSEHSSTTPYAYNDRGYGEGIFSFYFSAADVTSLGLTWEGSYSVRLQGNPSVFPTPPVISSGSITWRPKLATSYHLRNNIIALAQDLESAWVANEVDLVAATPEGNLLTSSGDEYFTNSINDFRLMIPGLFSGHVTNPDFTEREYSQSYADSLKDFWAGTEFDDAFTNWAAAIDMPKMLFTTILLLALNLFIAFWAFKFTNSTEFAFLTFALILPIGALIGLTELVFAALVAALSILGVGYVLFYKHA